MGWKNWPYWLKGGSIGVLYLILITIVFLFLGFSFCFDSANNLPLNWCKTGVPMKILYFPTSLWWFGTQGSLWTMISIILFYIIIGAIIGWIYGKIKDRKK